jgi:hypothetical protein
LYLEIYIKIILYVYLFLQCKLFKWSSRSSKPRVTHRLACKITLLDPHTALGLASSATTARSACTMDPWSWPPQPPLLGPCAPVLYCCCLCYEDTRKREERRQESILAFSVTSAFHLLLLPPVRCILLARNPYYLFYLPGCPKVVTFMIFWFLYTWLVPDIKHVAIPELLT